MIYTISQKQILIAFELKWAGWLDDDTFNACLSEIYDVLKSYFIHAL